MKPSPLAARAPVSASAALAAGLATCEHLLDQHLSAVERVFGGHGLGVIDLPALGPEPIVAAQLRVAAALLWCRELELVGLLPLVEALAEALARGELALPLGRALQRLVPFWKERDERLSAPERHAIYRRVFEGSSDEAGPLSPPSSRSAVRADAELEALVDTLLALGRSARDEEPSGLRAQLALRARELGYLLSERAVGIAAFAARDIVAQIQQALELLREPELGQVLGGGDPWTLLARWGPRLLGRAPNVSSHFARAEAGRTLLGWIADNAARLDGAARRVERAHELVHAAERWRGATPRAA
jgi:hypothetical protein